MIEELVIIIEKINHVLWSAPLLILLMGTHLFFTIKLNFPQLYTLKAISLSLKGDSTTKENNTNLSGFATLTTTLAATLGTGNIIGISTAVALGGPGAIFWCWFTGILGMATSYSECYLSIFYQQKSPQGISYGGPMYVLEKGLHSPLLGKVYAFLTLIAAFCIGCMIQSNAIKEMLSSSSTLQISPSYLGIFIALVIGLVIIGGISSISKFCMTIIPLFGFIYIACCLLLLWFFRDILLATLSLILTSAFHPSAITSGVASGGFMQAARFGIARGLFTNEAGIGTAAIAAGGSNSTDPKFQGLVSMTAVFWDTVVICALTGIVVVANIIKFPNIISQISHSNYTTAAFSHLPYGSTILFLSLITFCLTTSIGWCYFGEVATTYLFKTKTHKLYHFVYLFMIYLGATLPLDLVWGISDFINGLMIFPNVLALWCLCDKIFPPRQVRTHKV